MLRKRQGSWFVSKLSYNCGEKHFIQAFPIYRPPSKEKTQQKVAPLAKQREPRTAPQHIAPPQPQRPVLSNVPQFLQLELQVEQEYRPQMLAALEEKVNEVIERSRDCAPTCVRCGRSMGYHDTRRVSWLARFGRVVAWVPRYRCGRCKCDSRPVLEQLGVEPGRISGSLARLLTMLAVVAPYQLAAELAWLLLGVKISPMGIWRVAQRMGEAAARYSEGLSKYHSDSRSDPTLSQAAPGVVVLGVDGCVLGMQVRKERRRLRSEVALEALPVVETGHFREVKTGVLLLPSERVVGRDCATWVGWELIPLSSSSEMAPSGSGNAQRCFPGDVKF